MRGAKARPWFAVLIGRLGKALWSRPMVLKFLYIIKNHLERFFKTDSWAPPPEMLM